MANSVGPSPEYVASTNPQRNHRQNGRCYGRLGNSLLPVDNKEQDRQDILHKFFTVARGSNSEDQNCMQSINGLHARPLICNGPPRVLDLGCGTGIWCIDMADLYPNASIIGWDLSLRMQPEMIPPGVQFLPKDITDPMWDLGPNSMDLIHMRLLGGCVADWRSVYQNVFNHLKPGTGLFEHIELDYRPFSHDKTLPENSVVHQWMREVYGAYERYGKPLFPKDDLPSMLQQLGFVDITHEKQEIPYHPWPEDEQLKYIARCFNVGMQSAIPAMSLAPLTRYAGWNLEQVNKLNDKVRLEICMLPKHFSCTMHIWHARKP